MRTLSKLKICFLAGTLEHGGAERQLFHMLRALCREGAIPRVLCLNHGEFWEKPIRSLGVPVTWVGQSPSRLARLVRIVKELRNNLPELVQCQHFFANAYAALSARLLGISGIGAMRNEGEAEIMKNGPLGGWLNLRSPRFIAANSRLAIRQAVARGIPPSRLHFLPNVVDTRTFKPASHSAAPRPILLSVGRIVKEKGFDRFISALGRLRSEFNLEVRGWLAGPAQDPALRRNLQAQATKLGLGPAHLQFLGSVSRMAPLYQKADVCVLTSDFEGTPNVLLEGMASGLPVVATNVGGVPDIVRNGITGLVVEPGDQDGLVAALAELVKSPPRRLEMGRRAREFVETSHSVESLPSYLANLYELVLAPQVREELRIIEGTSI